MHQRYYQLGGFQSPIQWYRYDDKNLAQAVVGDGSPLRPRGSDSKAPVELAIGIKTPGTSHLLLTEDQARSVAEAFRLPTIRAAPLVSTAFESISPIYFNSTHELVKKLGTLKTKSHKGRNPVDNSQINKQYTSGTEGIQRAAFEHGRLVYHILQNTLDLRRYGLEDRSWAQSIQILSFVFNTPLVDQRPSQERLLNPLLLDIGISEATIPDLRHKEGSSIHLSGSWNKFLSRGNREAFVYGKTEELDRNEAELRIREVFKDKTGSSSRPTILLVHGDQISRNILKNCGVDTSSWVTGVKGLLDFGTFGGASREPGPSRLNDPRLRHRSASHVESLPYDDRRNRPRSRSQSPPPRGSRTSHLSSPQRSPPRRSSVSSDQQHTRSRSYPPIYVIDIQQLYIKLVQSTHRSEVVNKIAMALGLSDTAGWCAGNESVRIIEIWRSMISGPPIDDQRALVTVSQAALPRVAGETAVPPDADGSDDERDPNDIVQDHSTVSFGLESDDDSDYGQSDSE